MRPTHATVIAAGVLLAAGCSSAEIAGETVDTAAAAAATIAASDHPTLTVHKTASCECCGEYESYLAEHGVAVEVEVHEDVAPLKDDFGVPDDQRSCHTNEIAGYFVEGHVPLEAITALLEEAPDVDGISLAGMPPGAPGMPGEQTEPFVITTAVDGAVVGELGSF